MLRYIFAAVVTALLIVTASIVRADAPQTIGLQGVLEDTAGNPKPDGTYTLGFRLFDAPKDGSMVWQEPSQTVTVAGGKGQFSTLLGATTPFAISFNQPYYLEVQVQGESGPMSPRLPLVSAPYAVAASSLAIPSTSVGTVASPDGAVKVVNYASGSAVLGYNVSTGPGISGTSAGANGMEGTTSAANAAGVYGRSSGTGTYGAGVVGSGHNNVGVYGTSDSNAGIWGYAPGNTGVYGQSDTGYGVAGISTSNGKGTGNHGVYGKATVPYTAGVYGTNSAPLAWGLYGDEQGAGGAGVVGTASGSSASVGVFGSTLTGYGVEGQGNGAGAIGVHGQESHGVYGELGTSSNGYPTALLGDVGSVAGYSLYAIGSNYLDGILTVHGDLSVSGAKHFRIDDPLDPANKILTHSSAEGPEPLDIYNGNVTLDANGQADVHLPDYFEALNRDFRYQLTAVGAPGPNLYIAEEVHGNRFRIAGGQPGGKVSWQVTGVRNDAYVKAHPQKVEEMKPVEQRGRYLDPESYGQSKEKAIDYLAIGQQH